MVPGLGASWSLEVDSAPTDFRSSGWSGLPLSLSLSSSGHGFISVPLPCPQGSSCTCPWGDPGPAPRGASPLHTGLWPFSALLPDCSRPPRAGPVGSSAPSVSVAVLPRGLRGPLSPCHAPCSHRAQPRVPGRGRSRSPFHLGVSLLSVCLAALAPATPSLQRLLSSLGGQSPVPAPCCAPCPEWRPSGGLGVSHLEVASDPEHSVARSWQVSRASSAVGR